MTRLLVHVEGQSEEQFVNELLAPYLYDFGYTGISARLIGNARLRHRRGGIRSWNIVRKDIAGHLKEDPGSLATTMVDYYALPKTGSKAWPGRLQATRQGTSFEKAKIVEDALLDDIANGMGSGFDKRRFLPYVTMHEFEALLFSDCDRFAQGIGLPELTVSFKEIRDQFASPEEIDDSPDTAPSKRIEALVRGYQKPLIGSLAAREIGLKAIFSACPHFRHWLKLLERLPDRMGE